MQGKLASNERAAMRRIVNAGRVRGDDHRVRHIHEEVRRSGGRGPAGKRRFLLGHLRFGDIHGVARLVRDKAVRAEGRPRAKGIGERARRRIGELVGAERRAGVNRVLDRLHDL